MKSLVALFSAYFFLQLVYQKFEEPKEKKTQSFQTTSNRGMIKIQLPFSRLQIKCTKETKVLEIYNSQRANKQQKSEATSKKDVFKTNRPPKYRDEPKKSVRIQCSKFVRNKFSVLGTERIMILRRSPASAAAFLLFLRTVPHNSFIKQHYRHQGTNFLELMNIETGEPEKETYYQW